MESPGVGGDFSRSFWRSAPVVDSEISDLAPGDLPLSEFRMLADNIPTLCWIANGDGYIVWYNRRWHEYCGTTPEEMEGWGWQSVHDPELLPAVMERWTKSIATGEPFEMTFPLRGADGLFRPFLTRVQPLRDSSGKTVRWFGVNTEISEQVAVERRLQEASERVELALNAGAIAGTWVWDIPNDKFTADERFARSFGLDPQQCRDGIPLSVPIESIHPDDLPGVEPLLEKALTTGGYYRAEYRVCQADGEYHWVEAVGRCELAPDGTPLRFPGVLVDIDLRKKDEAALAESEEKHRRIFEQTSDLIFTADLDQVITACNPAAAEAIGLSRDEAIGRRISEFVTPEDLELTRQMLRRKLEHGGTTRYELRVHSSGGEWRYWEINSGLTFDEGGSPVGIHVVGRDITDRKRLERHQQILVAELNHRVKNTLAIVQSLAHQTFRNDAAPKQAIAAFEGRLRALAVAHNLLTGQSWEAASISDVIRTALAPFCPADRCEMDGPDVRLAPETAVSLSLAIHELATNASKYGALSNKTGSISIIWTAEEDRFELHWRESGGPPVESPARSGFGTRMIRRTLAAEFNGEVELIFAQSGFQCRVSGPMPAAPAD
jgi:PAS domain S-box-containing protein